MVQAKVQEMHKELVGLIILFQWTCNLHVLLSELVSSLQHFPI